MPPVHSIGRVFVHKFSYPSKGFPVVCIGRTQETTWPFRIASPVVVRVPLSRHGFVIGRWGVATPEDEALERAVSGELIGYVPCREYGDNHVVPKEASTSSFLRESRETS